MQHKYHVNSVSFTHAHSEEKSSPYIYFLFLPGQNRIQTLNAIIFQWKHYHHWHKGFLGFVQYHFSIKCWNKAVRMPSQCCHCDSVLSLENVDVVQSDIKDSWCHTVCLDFSPTSHWHHIIQSDKLQSQMTEKISWCSHVFLYHCAFPPKLVGKMFLNPEVYTPPLSFWTLR